MAEQTKITVEDAAKQIYEVYARVASGRTRGAGGAFYANGKGTLCAVQIDIDLLKQLAVALDLHVFGRDHDDRHSEPKAPAVKYYTYGHNVEECLRNGSYVRQDPDGRMLRFMNGDYMGDSEKLPAGMVEVSAGQAKELLPKCCK